MCLLLFRELVVGDETANEDARLLMKHSKLWVRFGLWIILFLGVSYITLSDFWVLDGRYYNECVYTLLVMLYLAGVYGTTYVINMALKMSHINKETYYS